jgi:phosphatidylinositol kinase/protein kinase (PI-3  family)
VLRVSNTILATAERGLHAQHYSVIPVGESCGLIQWVNDCTSLFSLFRAAQERAQQQPQQKACDYLFMRPNDLYQQRMVAALRNSGVQKIGPRQDWPAEVVLDVFTELVNTMRPSSSLLSRELWATSLTSADWLSKVDSYSRQLAVTSMLGYLIGLGDRHLDNILINCTTGSVLHIDFNVAFDKGLRLRVPEIVPFRMTQVVKHALGICGTAGMFTHSCETVWSAMRKRKELVGELLEIFVYDPLVDWKGPQPVGAGSGDSDSDEEHDDNSQDEVVQTEPNEHALQIVSGVVAKLSTTLTVHDQVSALISDATNPKRLCLMYEGWCAWM